MPGRIFVAEFSRPFASRGGTALFDQASQPAPSGTLSGCLTRSARFVILEKELAMQHTRSDVVASKVGKRVLGWKSQIPSGLAKLRLFESRDIQ